MKFAQIARPYFFEIFTVVNLIVLFAVYPEVARPMVDTFAPAFASFLVCFLVPLLIAIFIRLALASRRGTSSELLASYRSRDWLSDSIRITIFSGVWIHAYTWIKLATPVLHPQLFDQQLWHLDRFIAFGYAPTVFLTALFSNSVLMRFFDDTYITVLFPALSIVPAFIASMPERRVRIAFVNSNALLWLIGAWLYVAVPSLGPAYRFPSLWLPLGPMLKHTQYAQRLLIENYEAVRSPARWNANPINIFFGVAAFPSLHVGFQVLSFLWMRRLTRWSAVFGILAFLALIGSVVTGWHYLVDGIAGGLLAWACYAAAQRIPAIRA